VAGRAPLAGAIMIKVAVLACNHCGFKVSSMKDHPTSIEAIQNHYKNDHKTILFEYWESMHREEVQI
jgi:hypothetical protein